MLVHIPIAVGLQIAFLLLGRALGAPTVACAWLGALAGTAVCVMREITQREYQWIEKFGGGMRANMPFYEGLKVWEWNAHSISESAMAILSVCVVAGVLTAPSARSCHGRS